MAYRKTEKIRAQLDARRASIIAAAIDVIRRQGIQGLTTTAICTRGKFSMGLIYKDFPDIVEVSAAVMVQLLDRDLAAIREQVAKCRDPLSAFVTALEVLFTRWDNANLVKAMMDSPVYRAGIRSELEALLPPGIKGRRLAAAGALGALYGFHDINDGPKNRASVAIQFALRGIGAGTRVMA